MLHKKIVGFLMHYSDDAVHVPEARLKGESLDFRRRASVSRLAGDNSRLACGRKKMSTALNTINVSPL